MRIRFLLFLAALLPTAVFADGAVDSVFNRTYGAAKDLTFDQKLNTQLPLEATFNDENGREVKLAEYFGKTPVILAMAYYKCPNICTVVFRETFQTLQRLNFDGAQPYQLVFVSISPSETPVLAKKKKNNFQRSYENLPIETNAHFLTGDESNIRKVADAMGFQYRWEEALKQYVHPSGIVVATPEGKLSRYLYGIRYDQRDLRLALVEASENKIGNFTDQLLLFCYQYDPHQGKYGFAIMGAVRALGGLTVAGLGGFIFTMLRRDRRRKKGSDPSAPNNDKEGPV
jgi:protein SCO1